MTVIPFVGSSSPVKLLLCAEFYSHREGQTICE